MLSNRCSIVEAGRGNSTGTLARVSPDATPIRYRCTGCGQVWRQDTALAAQPRAKLSRRGLRWALEAIVVVLILVEIVLALLRH